VAISFSLIDSTNDIVVSSVSDSDEYSAGEYEEKEFCSPYILLSLVPLRHS